MWLLVLAVGNLALLTSGQIVIGHRGDPTLCPENTMPSFESAVRAGVQGVESDLRMTKDGVVVLLHDATLNRTTNCTGAVSDWSFAELRSNCDAGSWFNESFAGTRVPSFKEMLTYVRDASDYVMVMDVKQHGIARQIADVVLELGMQARVIASCWAVQDALDLSRYLNITVKQKLGSLPDPMPADWLFGLRQDGFHALSVNIGSMPPSFYIDAAKNLMPLFLWTVDTVPLLKQAHAEGASVISNVPRLAKTVFFP